MIKTRELTNFEKFFVYTKEKIHFAVEVKEPDYIPKIIQNLKHYNSRISFKIRRFKIHLP